jgi:hypothetical protein
MPRRGPRSIGVLRANERKRRLRDDVEVKQNRPVLDVIEVVLDAALNLFLAVGLAAPAVDLRPAGDARLDTVAREITVDRLVIKLVLGLGVYGVRGADRRAKGCRRTPR